MNKLNPPAQQFATMLTAARQYSQQRTLAEQNAECLHVVGVGRTLSSVYEHVRNAAEYTEDHLLLQRAVRRFYRRLFISNDEKQIAQSGEDVVTELTLAGYLANDTVPMAAIEELSRKTGEYYHAFKKLSKRSTATQQAWTVDVLATEVDAIVRNHAVRESFEQFAFEHFRTTVDIKRLYKGDAPREHELLLFVAVHRALLKSDDATIRWALLRRFEQRPSRGASYEELNERIDGILRSKQVEPLYRLVTREGAVFRVMWRTISTENTSAELMAQPDKFLVLFEDNIEAEYEDAERRINRGVLRSILFLLITKAIIGVAVEVPYDFWAHGEILWLPLAVNLLIPPVYMFVLRLTLSLPGSANTRALVSRAEQLLYGTAPVQYKVARQSRQFGVIFNAVYALLIIAMFGIASWLLIQIGFSIVHLIIFFIFFSTASFLGFRLSRTIRELETVDSRQDGVAMLRDFIYLPFVVVGRKLSESYAKFNIIATLLDMCIE
jgi:hypothetical protein